MFINNGSFVSALPKSLTKSKTRRTPYSPKIAPEAPSVTVFGWIRMLTMLAVIPVNKYAKANFLVPSIDSKNSPANRSP